MLSTQFSSLTATQSDEVASELFAKLTEVELLTPWLVKEMWRFYESQQSLPSHTLGRAHQAAVVRSKSLEDFDDSGKSASTAEATWCWGTSALLESGRSGLAKALRRCGGAKHVAVTAGFRVVRKPSGYWDEPIHMDIEIERYLHGQWLYYEGSGEGREDYWCVEIARERRGHRKAQFRSNYLDYGGFVNALHFSELMPPRWSIFQVQPCTSRRPHRASTEVGDCSPFAGRAA